MFKMFKIPKELQQIIESYLMLTCDKCSAKMIYAVKIEFPMAYERDIICIPCMINKFNLYYDVDNKQIIYYNYYVNKTKWLDIFELYDDIDDNINRDKHWCMYPKLSIKDARELFIDNKLSIFFYAKIDHISNANININMNTVENIIKYGSLNSIKYYIKSNGHCCFDEMIYYSTIHKRLDILQIIKNRLR